ncbi:ribosomal protein S18-alanine N-acetyltransferase [Microbacterium aurantiacum]|uniref:ribosomal protein S18-alanine N-acetyltransferase n=1 Tax=Microbacterium aurantiacum TaxID=162393 RepID=UPI000C805DBD|nr:ribosomal protein S18-alanine N-acetyltransferase [Microbacterium aurantiacum]
MTLRPAGPDDLDAIMGIETRSFPSDAWSTETMGAELASPHSVYLVDVIDGGIIGYGGIRALPGGTDADIQTIAYDAGHRGNGRGRALLRALLVEAKARGAREMFLEVRADNPAAEGLYRSEGFDEVGRRPHYYQPDDVDAIVMRLDLRGWSLERTSPASKEIAHDEGDPAGMAPSDRAESFVPREADAVKETRA